MNQKDIGNEKYKGSLENDCGVPNTQENGIERTAIIIIIKHYHR